MAEFSTPDLCDANAEVVRVLEPLFHHFGQRHCFHGPVTTLKCHEDNSLVGEVLGEPGAGRVLVVDGGGSTRCALLGDNLATRGSVNGWAGVVITGAVRDVDELAQIDLGIMALAANPLRSVKRGVGLRDVPLQLAGVYLLPGHFLYADRNGVVISPVALLD